MIISNSVEVCITRSNYHHYKNLGYLDVTINNRINVKVSDLTKGSHSIIDVSCDYCGEIIKMEYRVYNRVHSNKNFYVCSRCRFQKTKLTNREKYGVDNVSFIDDVVNVIRIKNIENSDYRKIKRTKTNLEKYGVENTFQSKKLMEGCLEKAKQTNIDSGLWVDYSNVDSWRKYKKDVMYLTYKNKKELHEKWDGNDYYDNEYIKDNYSLHYYHPDYPTIDHKISIKYGFDNNIPIEEISKIENLCFTKKRLNTRKNTKNEDVFKSIISLK